MNDPLGLFGEEQNSDPLGLFGEEDKSFSWKGAGEAALNLGTNMLLTPIAGLRGLGSLVTGGSLEESVKGIEGVQDEAYKPRGADGQRYAENASEVLNYIPEKTADFGEYVGGNEGRLIGEIGGEFITDLIPFGLIAKGVSRGRKGAPSKVDVVRSEASAAKPTPQQIEQAVTTYKPNDGLDGQMNLFEPEVEGRGISPYEATSGDWRIDENGMPVRVDLSLELQNLQNPLQRNLWGDELDPGDFGRDPTATLPMDRDIMGYPKMSENVVNRTDPEAAIPLTEAIDSMGWAQKRGAIRKTQLGREMEASGELEAAKMAAEAPQGFNARMRNQGGAIDPDVFLKDFPEFVSSAIKDASGKLKALYRGVREDYSGPERPMLGTLGEGIYLTESTTLANNYARGGEAGRHVKSVYADIKQPYEIEMGSPEHQTLLLSDRGARKAFSDQAKAAGYDGVIIKNGNELKEVVAFRPEQVQNAFSTPSSRIPKSQRGGVYFGKDEVKIDNSQVAEQGSLIPPNPEIAKVLEKAATEKDGKQWTYVQSGSTSTAMKSKSSAIKAASEIVQNALKRADLAIRNAVFPAEGSLRRLSKTEITELGTLMKDEMFSGERYDGNVLARNLSVKQLEAYRNMRDLFDKTLDAQNEARLAKGQEPISPKEAYLSSRWEGDFRRPVYDTNGKLVWYLAAKSKMGLESQSKALKARFPDLLIDPKKDHTVTSSQSKTDLQSMYSTMLDILGRDDPAIQKIQKAIEEQTVSQGEATLAQEKHFEKKANIRGFTGDRPGQSGAAEAIAMFQQQIQYAKNAFKWSEMQKAAEDIKAIVADPVLQETQPNNVKYIREYFKNAIGMGESQVSRAVGDALRTGLGVSPKVIDQAVGNMKSFFIMQKLAASPGYILSNMIQAGNTLPYLANLRSQGYKGNIGKAVLMGYPAGMAMGVAHILKATGGEYVDRLPNQFFKDAFQYAEQNGVTARSVYDEAPLQAGFGVLPNVANVAAKTMTVPETFVRATAFMTYAQMLKDSGKFTDQSKLFQKAEELVNMSMVDYRETERPLLFAKAGTAGNFMNTLQTFPMSFYNQWAYMLKEAVEGRPAGLLALAAFQYAVAGAMGIPGFQDAEELYKYIKNNLVSTGTWNEMSKSPFLSDPKLWMMENLGNSSVYGALSDQTGLGITSRVAAPGAGAMLQSPVGPIKDIAKQVGSAASALMDPTNPTKVAQAAMNSAPVGLQGLLETAPFMEGITYNTKPDGTKVFMKNSDLEDRSGTYARTPEEVNIRKWGVRSQKEVVERDVGYATKLANQTLDKKSSELGSKIYNAARNGDTERVKELNQLYIDITGSALPAETFNREIKEEFYTDIQKNAPSGNTSVRKLMNAAKMQKLLESR